MTLVLGTRHVVTGAGQFAIGQPVGLVVATTGIPNYIARDAGTPTIYHRMAHVNLGTALGWQPNLDLVASPQLVYPLAPEFTLLRYSFLAGETGTIDEIASATSTSFLMQPWDRNPTTWSQGAIVNTVGASSATAWTYTVPAGRKLLVSHAEIWWTRYAASSSAPQVDVVLNAAGGTAMEVLAYGNTVGDHLERTLAGQLVLLAGNALSVTVAASGTGGGGYCGSRAFGLLFDA